MFRNIQLLRAWGACLVLLHHFGPNYEAMTGSIPLLRWLMAYGYAGVDIFFCISGFIMMHVISDRSASPFHLRQFLQHRFLRIYGWYLPCLAVALLISWLAEPARIEQASLLKSATLTSVLMVDLVLPVSWSLSYELYFYLLVALAWMTFERHLRAVLWVSMLAMAIYLWKVPYVPDGSLRSFVTCPYVLEFGAGALLYLHKGVLARKAALPVYAAAFVYLCWMGVRLNAANGFVRIETFGAAAFFLLCFFVTLEEVGSYRAGRLAEALGDASYSIYLLHLPLLSSFYGSGLRQFLEQLEPLWTELGFALFIAAFLVGCILLHRFAERPLYLFLCRLAERIVARRAAPPGPLGNA